MKTINRKYLFLIVFLSYLMLSSCENGNSFSMHSSYNNNQTRNGGTSSKLLFSCSHQIELFDITTNNLDKLTSDDTQLYKQIDIFENEVYFVKTSPPIENSQEIGIEDIYKLSLLNRRMINITNDSNYDFNFSVSQKTGNLLYTSHQFDADPPNLYRLVTKNITNNKEDIIYDNPEQFYAYWSPDGTKIAIYQGYYNKRVYAKLFVYDVNTKQIKQYIEDELLIYRGIAWSPDSTMIAIPTEENDIQILELPSGIIIKSIGVENEPAYMEWSPDGRYIAFETLYLSEENKQLSNLWIYDFFSGDMKLLCEDSDSEYQPTWSPDSETLAYFVDGEKGNKKLILEDFKLDKTITEKQTTCGNIQEAKWVDSSEVFE